MSKSWTLVLIAGVAVLVVYEMSKQSAANAQLQQQLTASQNLQQPSIFSSIYDAITSNSLFNG